MQKKYGYSFGTIAALLLAGLYCGGSAVSNIVKWRDEGKNLAIVCNLKMSEPGLKEDMVYNYDTKSSEPVVVYNAKWSEVERKDIEKYSADECQKIQTFLKDTMNYKNVEIVDLKKVPEAEQDVFGKKVKFPDFSQTRFDYVWHITTAAEKKTAFEICSSSADAGRNCIYAKSRINTSYMVDDWSKKDPKAARGVPFQDYQYAYCGNSNKLTETNVRNVNDSDFSSIDQKVISQCTAESGKKIDQMKKDAEKAASKKS